MHLIIKNVRLPSGYYVRPRDRTITGQPTSPHYKIYLTTSCDLCHVSLLRLFLLTGYSPVAGGPTRCQVGQSRQRTFLEDFYVISGSLKSLLPLNTELLLTSAHFIHQTSTVRRSASWNNSSFKSCTENSQLGFVSPAFCAPLNAFEAHPSEVKKTWG